MTDKTEIEVLKEKADLIGVPYSPNIGLETLKERVAEKMEGNSKAVGAKTVAPRSFKEDTQRRQQLIKDATKLIRVLVTNRNPNKKDVTGEYFTFANAAVGTITRLVPFNTETHVEQGILNAMTLRKYAKVTMKKNAQGVPYPERRVIDELGVEILTPLTEQELKDLAADQAKRGAIDK
jgi:hypothetical protein